MGSGNWWTRAQISRRISSRLLNIKSLRVKVDSRNTPPWIDSTRFWRFQLVYQLVVETERGALMQIEGVWTSRDSAVCFTNAGKIFGKVANVGGFWHTGSAGSPRKCKSCSVELKCGSFLCNPKHYSKHEPGVGIYFSRISIVIQVR